MVEPEVPDRGEGLPKSDECARSSNYCTCDDVPVVVDCAKLSASRGDIRTRAMSLTFIDSESTGDQYGPKDRSEEQDHFPVCGIVRAHDLQLSIEVQGQEDEASKCGGRMARRKRFEGVVDIFLVPSADRPVVHVICKLRAGGWGKLGHVRLANGVEVRTEAPN